MDTLNLVAHRYRDERGYEYTQVTASCRCGRGGFLRLPLDYSDPDLSPFDHTTDPDGTVNLTYRPQEEKE